MTPTIIKPTQREQLEYALVQGASTQLAASPVSASQIAEGIKTVLDALHPRAGEPSKFASITLPVLDLVRDEPAIVVLTEADAAADLAGTPRPDNPSA